MPVSFDHIALGETYSRNHLARLWGYATYQALARGVVTPKNDDKIILFVTREKQASATPYQDLIRGNRLLWDGPNDHFAEERMLGASRTGDEIHLFYRDRHHMDFTYHGRLEVVSCRQSPEHPSQFVFTLASH
jgi:putative restriction endonuclease